MFWNVCIANDFFLFYWKYCLGFVMKWIVVYSTSSSSLTNKKTWHSSKYILPELIIFLWLHNISFIDSQQNSPKKYWYYFYIFIGIFFQSAIKNLQWTAILLRVPSYYPTFSPTTIIYEHIHAIVLLSVYLQYSIHFNLWFSCYQRMVTTFPLLKTIKWRKRNCNYQGMFMSGFVRDILIKMRYIF